MVPPITISEVNSLSDEQFKVTFGNVIELCEAAAVKVKDRRPFDGVADLCEAFQEYLEEVTIEKKIEVLKLHPDLAGRLAAQGQLTKESTAEQRAAGLHNLTPEQKSIIDKNNERYKKRFGFPFIICAKENKVQSIMEGLEKRIKNSHVEEVNTGINEVKKICRLRILDIVNN